MPPRTRSRSRPAPGPPPLSETDVSLLRERLEAGKKPRVVLLVDTALGAAGTSVPVVSFTEPAVGEFISIRLRDDVVPFSPTELSLPVRGRQPVLPGEPAPSTTVSPKPSGAPSTATPPATPGKAAAAPTSPSRPPRLVAVPEPQERLELPDTPPTALPPAGSPAAPPRAAPPADPGPAPAKASGRKPARAGGVSVTMRFGGQNWTYESTRGGRRSSARPLNLAAVRAFADRLDDPALRRDLQGAIDVSRQQAQARADALRAELERVEVELADLDE